MVIGLSDYTEYWNSLESPYHDAIKVREFLIDKAKFDNVVILTNKKATKEKINKYMEEILPSMVGSGDRFLFYYSGHGTQRILGDRIRGYLPMLDSGKETWADMISMDDIERWNENLSDAQHALFILDCCFSGLAGTEVKGERNELYLNDLAKYGHHLITAGGANEKSFGSLARWGGSLFTIAFINGASGKADTGNEDFPQDGIVSLNELFEYLRKQIKKEAASNSKINQTPKLSNLGQNDGEFFFVTEFSQSKPTWRERFSVPNSLSEINPAEQRNVDQKGESKKILQSPEKTNQDNPPKSPTSTLKTLTDLISLYNNTWQVLPGLATDIGIGANGSTWIIGKGVVSGGYGVYKWNGRDWDNVGGGGVKIAVDPKGIPWIINSTNNIFRRVNEGVGYWDPLPGLARDIGIGANGTVWIIGNSEVTGGYGIYRWNGRDWNKVDGGGVRIAVDPKGMPWIINSGNSIFRQIEGGVGWESLPGLARDIGIGANGDVWVIGNSEVSGVGYGIYKWNGYDWDKVDGGGIAISVDPNGKSWVITSTGSLLKLK